MAHKTVPLAGLSHRNVGEQLAWEETDDGAELILEAEPDNQYDAGAIKVMCNGHHVGYIPKASAEIREAFAAGRIARVEKKYGKMVSAIFAEDEDEGEA